MTIYVFSRYYMFHYNEEVAIWSIAIYFTIIQYNLLQRIKERHSFDTKSKLTFMLIDNAYVLRIYFCYVYSQRNHKLIINIFNFFMECTPTQENEKILGSLSRFTISNVLPNPCSYWTSSDEFFASIYFFSRIFLRWKLSCFWE